MRGLLTAVAVSMLAMSAGLPAGAEDALDAPSLSPDDWQVPVVVEDDGLAGPLGLFDADPKGLVPKTPFVQRYSLDQDRWEVWLCGNVTTGMADVIGELEDATVDYFDAMSGGVYEPVFTAGGTIPAESACLPDFLDGINPTVGSPEGIVIIDDITGGGYASPGTICVSDDPDCPTIPSTFPTNRRYVVMGETSLLGFPSVAVHEFGHALQWPHSNSSTGGEYDNPIDLMSGNSTTGGSTEPDPYGTLSYNRYQSGWFEQSDVVVATGASQSLTLQPFNRGGTQLLAVRTDQEGRFYVFGARTTSAFDPIPSAWQGVEVYVVDHYCGEPGFGGGICPGLFRSHTQQPPSPQGVGHVLQPGESIEVEGLTITIGGSAADGYQVTVDANGGLPSVPSAPGTPLVSAGGGQATISWSAAGGGGSPITGYTIQLENRGDGSRTSTTVGVTLSTVKKGLLNGATYRARVRAMNAVGTGPWSGWSVDFVPTAVVESPPNDPFSDDDGSVFEKDIEWLAAIGITRGCNPPANDLFCPDDPVTRGQMAAFLVRAFGYGDDGGGDLFVDDDGSVFEGDIDRLATAGVTRGCNPPAGDRFCPDDLVTRGQMAAFLVRAFGYGDDGGGDLFVDDDGSVFEGDIDRLATAGVTFGCNPPVGDWFCPNNVVTRGQMAAFLHRAIG